MEVHTTPLEGVLVIEPDVHGDGRGFFMETYSRERYLHHGIGVRFVQDNLSFSEHGVLRGLHYQHPKAQGKLVSVLSGAVFDVALDIRVGSPTFGAWYGVTLSDENKKQFYVPPDFAHGFVVVSETALFSYKCTEYYSPEDEGAVRWDDPALNIDWPVRDPELSPKDRDAPRLEEIPRHRLPRYRPR